MTRGIFRERNFLEVRREAKVMLCRRIKEI